MSHLMSLSGVKADADRVRCTCAFDQADMGGSEVLLCNLSLNPISSIANP
jgi:hypothetical protein